MAAPATPRGEIDLRVVTVRPTWGAQEHRRWDRLVAAHHYLPFHGVFGKGLRHVATLGSMWLALVGWQPGAFKLAARDRWIGWSAEQQFARLHLIAHNARFVKGRGGTDFWPGFAWLDEQGIEPGVCLYFTDMECSDYPEAEPGFPTLWVDFGDPDSPWRHPAPWCEHISLAA